LRSVSAGADADGEISGTPAGIVAPSAIAIVLLEDSAPMTQSAPFWSTLRAARTAPVGVDSSSACST
jgi:hypothetical protein